MKRNIQSLLCGAIALVALQSSQAVVTLTPITGNTGGWERVKWTTSGSPGAVGSGVDSDGRVLAWSKNDAFRFNDDNDVFEFTIPANSVGYVEFTDIEGNSDGYSILDFNTGLASIGSGAGAGDDLSSIEGDPEVTFADPSWASGSFSVLDSGLGGTFQFKVQRVIGSMPNTGGLFVRARTETVPSGTVGVPEPSSSIVLMLLGVVGLASRRRS